MDTVVKFIIKDINGDEFVFCGDGQNDECEFARNLLKEAWIICEGNNYVRTNSIVSFKSCKVYV